MVLGCTMLMTGCITVKNNQLTAERNDNMIVGGKLYSAIWMQRSAEYKALCIQAYNIADLRLNQILTYQKPAKPLAIVTDIDETFLDNSAYAVHQALQNKDYQEKSWDQWVQKAQADTLAGALKFFQDAAKKGVAIFYITNRNTAGRAATLRNLQKYQFPNADDSHLLTKGSSSSKEDRRNEVSQNYHIALLLGDNLSDFSALFDKEEETQRSITVLEHSEDFGKRFIILPNPNYGDWETSLYQYNYQLSPAQKDSVFKANAKSY